ncbi:MAG: GGDEF domain-containing protein [Gammaproteobacteria bacterium]|nr:MAG: GGDEF domain-containing protein [Gammaproteobacteria bacterium]UTW42112.1 GGDEF domain-containing protein [bacterium SCSIO 12844]
MKNGTHRLQKLILRYSILAIVLVSVIVACISIYPLYSKLRQTEQQGLIFARDTSVLIVNEYLSRIKDIARQVSSRTKAKQLLEDYQKGKITKADMQKYLNTILEAALKGSRQLVGITRIDLKNEVMASVGQPITSDFKYDLKENRLYLYGPFVRDNHYYVLLSSPIFNQNNQPIGIDLTLFDIDSLQENIYQEIHHKLGEIVIARIDNNQLIDVFFPIKTPWVNSDSSDNKLQSLLGRALQTKAVGVELKDINNQNVFIAYAPLHQAKWAVGVIIKQSTLFASIQVILWVIISIIIIIVILFVLGLSLCLRPLSGRIIMNTNELKQQIQKSQKELEEANKKLNHLVIIDPLTQVLNRRGFKEAFKNELSLAKRHGLSLAVLYIDLDNFKPINDQYGHKAGDILLQTFTNRIKENIRCEDKVARLGGDEFVVLAPHATKNDAISIIEKLYKAVISMPIKYEQQAIEYSASFGYSVYPADGEDVDQLLKVADQRMYQAKKEKK